MTHPTTLKILTGLAAPSMMVLAVPRTEVVGVDLTSTSPRLVQGTLTGTASTLQAVPVQQSNVFEVTSRSFSAGDVRG